MPYRRAFARFRKGCSGEGSRDEENEKNTSTVRQLAQNRERAPQCSTRSKKNKEYGEEAQQASMEAEPPWSRIFWQRAPVATPPTKKCSHPLCSWQQCEIRLCALFWAENPAFLAVYEERDPARRDALMNRTGISLHTNHITITQYCDQKTRAYQFDDDPSAAHQDWMTSGRRVSGQLFRWFKPTFEVVYEHKGCLQAGNSIPIVAGGSALIADIYYRRCDGKYRNICGQVLQGGTGQQIIAKVPQGSVPYHLTRDFRPFFASDFHTWAQGIIRKQAGLIQGTAVRIQLLGSETMKGKDRASEPPQKELVTERIGPSKRKIAYKAEEGGDDEEKCMETHVSRKKRKQSRIKGRSATGGGKAAERERERERERTRYGTKSTERTRTKKRGRFGERPRPLDTTLSKRGGGRGRGRAGKMGR